MGWFVVSAAAHDIMHLHKRRLHGGDRPHGQNLVGLCTQVAPTGILLSFLKEKNVHLKFEFIIMPVTKVMQISALKCTESVWRPGFARTHWVGL